MRDSTQIINEAQNKSVLQRSFMDRIGEVGLWLGVGVALTTLLGKFGAWIGTWLDRYLERWYLGWTREGEVGDEHFGVMLARHKGKRR